MEKKEPIRILHVLQRMEAGGTQALLMNIYRNIDRTKVQFDFLVEYPSKQFYDDEIVSLGGKIYYTNVRNDYNILRFEGKLKQILKANNYNIIHVHAYTIGYFVLKTAKKCGVPVRIAHSHNNETVRDIKYYPKLLMQKLYTVYATYLFACSNEAGKYLFKNRSYNVLNNAIDSKKFVYNEDNSKKIIDEFSLDNKIVYGHVGRMHPQKNHKFLIDVFEKIKTKQENAVLLLVGTGPLEDEIKKYVDQKNLSNCVFFLENRSDMPNIYAAMDTFIFPSLFEGLGIVAVEAQASGTPVLCSDRLPAESNISPLYESLSLNDSEEIWSGHAIKQTKNAFKHKNMQKYVVDAGYDICSTAYKMQEFYLNKWR